MIAEGTRWHRLQDARIVTLSEGALLKLKVGGRAMVIIRHQGRLHAMADHCPHQDRALSGGWVENGHVVCPWHRIHFDLATGKAKHGVCSNVEVFAMKEDERGPSVGVPYTTLRIFGWDLW